jgi:hypothetical protein
MRTNFFFDALKKSLSSEALVMALQEAGDFPKSMSDSE